MNGLRVAAGVRGVSLAAPLAAFLAAAAVAAGTAKIQLRDGMAQREAELVDEGPDGITVRFTGESGQVEQSLRWDQVRSVDDGTAPQGRAERLAAGELLWRGRSRLARGDLRAARSAFTAAAAQVEANAQRMRLLALEGLALTAPAAPDDPACVVQALEAAALRSALGLTKSAPLAASAADSFDPASGLLLAAPPAWAGTDAAAAALPLLEAAAARARSGGDAVAADLLEDAARIAAAESGHPRAGAAAGAGKGTPSPSGALRTGARVLDLWAQALDGDAAQRKRAQQALGQVERSENGGVRLLAIYAQGRSLVLEDDPEDVRRGVGKMLLIPAAHASTMPVLALAALEQSSAALTRIRDDASAGILRAALADMKDQLQGPPTASTGDTP